MPVSQIVQAQLLGSFGHHHCSKQFLLNGKKPTLPHRASRPRSIAAVDDADQTVCSLVVLASHGPDLVLAFHVPHGEIRSLVLHCFNVDTVIRILATNSSSFQLYCIVVSLAVQPPMSSTRSCQPRTPILARVFPAQSGVSALRLSVDAEDTLVAPGWCKTPQHDGMRRRARPVTQSSPAPLPCNRTSSRPAAVHGPASARKLMNPI